MTETEFRAYSVLSQEHSVKFQGPYRRLDDVTLDHSERVAQIAERIAYTAGFRWGALRRIKVAGLLHDVGKVFCDQEILWYPGVLTDEQKLKLRNHPVDSERVALENGFDRKVRRLIREHHEFVNGKGYPDGRKDILVSSSILKIADEWDRMTNPVPWRPYSLSPREAFDELHTHFGERYTLLLEPVVDAWYGNLIHRTQRAIFTS